LLAELFRVLAKVALALVGAEPARLSALTVLLEATRSLAVAPVLLRLLLFLLLKLEAQQNIFRDVLAGDARTHLRQASFVILKTITVSLSTVVTFAGAVVLLLARNEFLNRLLELIILQSFHYFSLGVMVLYLFFFFFLCYVYHDFVCRHFSLL
jgi:hypothetical protein